MESIPDPDIEEGIEYWNAQPASLDGVLGKQSMIYQVFKPVYHQLIGGYGSGVTTSSSQHYLTNFSSPSTM
jgi:hypothetical protein